MGKGITRDLFWDRDSPPKDKFENEYKFEKYFDLPRIINKKEDEFFNLPRIINKKEDNYSSSIKSEYYNKNNYLEKIISPYKTIQTSSAGFNLYLKDEVSITADNIGEFASPIVEYIRRTKPDYVIASDRGARLLGLAVFRLYHGLHGKFPTADGTIRFRRFSKSNSQEATERHLHSLVEEMLQYKERPTVLVLDDWIVSGGTKRLAEETFEKLSKGKIKTKFGVLTGNGADVSGNNSHTQRFAKITDWRDDSNIIGVKYNSNNYSGTLFDYLEIKATPVISRESRDYRRRMYKGIDNLILKIIEKILVNW